MSKELVIGSNRHQTKVAVLEDDQLVELYFERANEYSLAGSIHKGRVTRVLPGMQSAFVDLGLERDTFLYVSDFFEENEDIDTVGDEKPSKGDRRDRGSRQAREPVPEERASEARESGSGGMTDASPETAVLDEPAGISAAEVASDGKPSLDAVVPEVRPAERNDVERAFRGDRRGRRSRRRRHRGRGFPDNKYAQTEPSSPVDREPVNSDEQELEEVEESSDVLVLPGESLAKYRHIAAGSEGPIHSADPFGVPQNKAESESVESPSTGGDEQAVDPEAIQREAEELELAEKVFSHHDEELSGSVEEKIEEVKQDQPAPTVEPESRAGSDTANDELGSIAPVEVIPQNSESVSEEADEMMTEVPEGEPLEVDESESLVLEDTLGVDPGTEPVENSECLPAASVPQMQTASVRDQSSSYMHRSSRRMRRRRGGNRFSQNPELNVQAPIVASGITGAAPALDPEARSGAYEERSAEKADRPLPSITDLLKPGQEIIVQIAKEPLGQKGARITSHIALPGRYVVFMPSVTHLGVSRKIASDEERQRLKRILQKHRLGTTGGFIIRTAGEGIPEEEIAADMEFLYNLWLDIRQKAEKKPAPALLHYDLGIVQRVLRDQVTEEYKAIWVDNEELYENVVTFLQRFQPALVARVKMYTRSAPIFDAFNITQELEKALRPKVWLKSGGYIVINQTEALVAIDINTGKYVGKSNRLEDTIVKTNTEAVKEIVRQIRLRDLGGIIVVDFIDMDERKNRQKVMQALEEAMRADRAPYKILQFNDFGLVAITRKRVKQSLERALCSPCPYCEGAGYVKSIQTILDEILIESMKIRKAIEGKDVVLRVHPDVAKILKASSNKHLEELEEILGRPVLVTGDPTLHHEKFDWA